MKGKIKSINCHVSLLIEGEIETRFLTDLMDEVEKFRDTIFIPNCNVRIEIGKNKIIKETP